MTKEMLKDYIKVIEKKYKIVLVLLIIVSILLVGMTIFAFSEFEITKETEYEIAFEAETGDGDNGTITQNNDMSTNKDGKVLVICISVVICVLIICVLLGVVFYGKIKNENKEKNKSYYKKEE